MPPAGGTSSAYEKSTQRRMCPRFASRKGEGAQGLLPQAWTLDNNRGGHTVLLMPSKKDVVAAVESLRYARSELAARLEDLRRVDGPTATMVEEQYSQLTRQSEDLLVQLDAWQQSKAGILKRRENPQPLLNQAEVVVELLDSASSATASMSSAPGRVMADVAIVVSRLSIDEQLISELAVLGGDMAEPERQSQQLRQRMVKIEELVQSGKYMQAKEMSTALAIDSAALSGTVRSERRAVDRLEEDLKTAKRQAREVNALASEAAEATSRQCPAAAGSLEAIKQVRGLFARTMQRIAAFEHGTPTAATTLVRLSLEDLNQSKWLLDQVLEIENTRNWAWDACTRMQDELATLVTELNRRRYRTEVYWKELDTIAGLLSAGQVEEAASRQEHLLSQVSAAYRPAIAAEEHKIAVPEGVLELGAAKNPLEVEGGGLLALPSGQGSEEGASGPIESSTKTDLEALRALVEHMAAEVRALTEELR